MLLVIVSETSATSTLKMFDTSEGTTKTLLLALIVVLLMLQPDFGSAVLFAGVWGVLVLLAACTSVTPPSDKLPPAEVPAAEGPLVVPPISALPDTPARPLSAKYTQVNWSDLPGWSNDDLRQKFIDATVPQAEVLGVTLPDPDLKWNAERGHYDHGEIDWDEFWQTVNGHGPMNKQRLGTRVKAHNDGAWVREAALAHAEKQRQRALKTAA